MPVLVPQVLMNEVRGFLEKSRKSILQILSGLICMLALYALLSMLYNHTFNSMDYRGSNPWVIGLFLVSFGCAHALAHLNRVKVGSVILIISLLVSAVISTARWGALLPQGLLMYVLVIIIAGILLGSTASLVLTLAICVTLLVLAYIQFTGLIGYDVSWKNDTSDVGDAITAAITLFIIFILAWIYNQNMEWALKKAIESEKALEIEKETLEVKVQERTKEIESLQREKMLQMSKFAEIGRLSSGIFHDLSNMLTVLSLNLERVSSTSQNIFPQRGIKVIKQDIKQGLGYVHKINDFIDMFRSSFKESTKKVYFKPESQVEDVLRLFEYRLRKVGVKVIRDFSNHNNLFGSDIKFFQVVKNLISNAIDSMEHSSIKALTIKTYNESDTFVLVIQDTGCGISDSNLNKVFEPFFTTKLEGKGMGLGMCIVKDIVSKNFDGKIEITSVLNKGTVITILIPTTEKIMYKSQRYIKSSSLSA